MTRSPHPGATVCQFCGEVFMSAQHKAIHATLAHADDDVMRFAACSACGLNTFVTETCSCGTPPREKLDRRGCQTDDRRVY